MSSPPVSYEDTFITCDEQGLTIRWYYFPLGDKFVPYDLIQRVDTVELGFEGKWRIWGMGLAPYWFHLDPGRPHKSTGILIDEGHPIKFIITPDQPQAVLEILQAKTQFARPA